MEPNKVGQHKLLALSVIDAKDELDEKFERCHMFVQNLIDGLSEKEAHDEMMSTVCRSQISHEEVCIGLLMSILTDQTNCHRLYRDLTYVSRDGMLTVINYMNQIVIEKYHKLHDNARTQLIWLVKEMVKNSIINIDSVCYNLLRQIAGGDISPKNIWLVENMLDIFIENRLWLEKINVLIATVVYTYLRLIVDHTSPILAKLRQREVDFCVSLLREKFPECIGIGRDLVRLLQNVARIPEFEKFWKDLLHNPESLAPNFGGILQLMKTRTSRRFLQCRLTPDMEKKICFLTSQVKFGQQKRYQEWFQKQYLSTPESQTLRCDVIRFICGVIHPTNEVLCSDIIPRWAVIGWLLTTCTSSVAASNAKLSLFYDWLFFDAERDNIMNIEPAILVMFNSIRSHPAITATLIDFLCRIHNFYPQLASLVSQGIKTSLQQILDKRVLPSLSLIFDCPKLDRELKIMFREAFPEFCSSESSEPSLNSLNSSNNNSDHHSNNNNNNRNPEVIIDSPNHNSNNNNSNNNISESAKFSDEEEENGTTKKMKKDNNPIIKHQNSILKSYDQVSSSLTTSSSRLSSTYVLPKIDLKAQIEQCGNEDIAKYLFNLSEERDNETRCEIMESLLQVLMQDEENDQDNSSLVLCLLCILQDELSKKVFPDNSFDEEAIEDSIGTPLFVMFRNLCQTPEEDPNRSLLLNLLAEMGTNHPRIGYLLLYYLKASKTPNSVRIDLYREYARIYGKDLTTCLLFDMRSCQEDDVNLFCYLIPEVYNNYSAVFANAELLNLIVSCIDSVQLQDLISQILQNNFKMFKKDSIISILNASLEWETFEQYFLWQLIAAHNIPIEQIISILPKLEYNKHAEALASIILMLQRETPTANLTKHILGREVKEHDFFVVSILVYWAQNHSDKLAELISSYLTAKINALTKRKRNPNNKVQVGLSLESVLAYLDQLRQKLGSKHGIFFDQESIQSILSQAQSFASDAQKNKYSDLFELAENYETKPTSKKGKNNAKGKNSKNILNDANSDSDLSEDDSPRAPKQSKHAQSRKKRKPVVGSDSD